MVHEEVNPFTEIKKKAIEEGADPEQVHSSAITGRNQGDPQPEIYIRKDKESDKQ